MQYVKVVSKYDEGNTLVEHIDTCGVEEVGSHQVWWCIVLNWPIASTKALIQGFV